jgi:hypothetical protein
VYAIAEPDQPEQRNVQPGQGQNVTLQRQVIRGFRVQQAQTPSIRRRVHLTGPALGFAGDLEVVVFGAKPVPAVSSALAVLPIGVPILSDEVRQALADVVREGLDQAVDSAVEQKVAAAGTGGPSVADQLTIIAFPFAPSMFVGAIVLAFAGPEVAAVWTLASFLIVVILMVHPDGDELRDRLATWLGSDDTED